MSCGELQIQIVGEHLLHHTPIGLPHQLNPRAMGTCVSDAMVACPNNEVQYVMLALYPWIPALARNAQDKLGLGQWWRRRSTGMSRSSTV